MELKYTYETLPKDTNYPHGMHLISGDFQNVRAKQVEKDVVYAVKDGIELKLRFVYPDYQQEKKKYPLFLHVQGSAWMTQSLSDHILDFKDIVTNGYIVAIVEYRPSNVAIFPAQVQDTKCAMRYIQQHSEELSIDLNNVFVSGESSGGHTSTLCWATWKNNKLDESQEPLCAVKGFINLYGISNLASIENQISAVDHGAIDSFDTLFLGGLIPSQHIQQALEASGIYYIDEQSNDDPLLIMHGNKDCIVPFAQSTELYEKCVAYQKPVEFYCVDGADHGGSVFYCDAVLDVIINFLKKHTCA